MDSYHFAELRFSTGIVSLECTEAGTLQYLLDGLKKDFSNLKTTPHTLNDDEVYGYEMKGFAGKEVEVGWWIIKQLSSRSWEPLGSVSYNPGSFNSGDQWVYQFKLKTSSK
jgi:hypothetical protein